MWLNKKNSKVLFLVLIIILVFVFIFLQGPIRSLFYSMTDSLQGWMWTKAQSGVGFWFGLLNANYLKTENKNLNDEVQLLLSRVVELNQLREENQKLREALDLGLADNFQLLEANVLSKDIAKDFILINKGEKDGISKGMSVITYQKVLVGEIDEVYNGSSHVRLITDYKMKFSVQIEGAEIQALARGQGNQKIILDLIPKDKELVKGALVFTGGPVGNAYPSDGGGLEGGFPEGFLVGKIGEIEKTDLTPFQKAEVNPFFNIQEANALFVITNEL